MYTNESKHWSKYKKKTHFENYEFLYTTNNKYPFF